MLTKSVLLLCMNLFWVAGLYFVAMGFRRGQYSLGGVMVNREARPVLFWLISSIMCLVAGTTIICVTITLIGIIGEVT